MITCERCGNDFNWGKRVERDGRLKVLCPYPPSSVFPVPILHPP